MLRRSRALKLPGVSISSRIALAATIAIVLAGCGPSMSPVAMPLVQGPDNLCSSTPAPPPKDLASKPNYVQFSVEVTDPSDSSLTGLQQSDFIVTQNAQALPIAFFRKESGRPPASIGILVDKSGSMVVKLPMVRASVAGLLSRINRCDEVFLYAFGVDPVLVQDFTTDHALISERLKAIHAWGQTPFYDAVQLGIERLNGGHYPNKALIIFTDDAGGTWFTSSGLDNASKNVTQEALIASALHSHSSVFIVGVGDPSASKIGVIVGLGNLSFAGGTDPAGLADFAKAVGGNFFLITGQPDSNASPVTLQGRGNNNPLGQLFTPHYRPLTVDQNQILKVTTAIASQIDDHYTIGVIGTAPASSDSTNFAFAIANHPSAVAITHPIAPSTVP